MRRFGRTEARSHAEKASRDAMKGQHNARVAEIIRSAAGFCEIRPIGEFADPEWVVLPPSPLKIDDE